MSDQELPRLEIEDSTDDYTRMVVEPLKHGFGTTIGSALRRVLLSALPGAAIVAVRIDQVQHEFSIIPDVREDTTELLLNIRGIRLRALSDRPAKLFLDVSGPRVVTAGDLEVPGDYEIVNPDLYLATLDTPKARLTATFDVEQGTGYIPAVEGDGLPIGAIPVDAIFSPVRKVNYVVQPTRVGQRSDLDRLILEVWTDGTISGSDAVHSAAQVIQSEMSLFIHLGQPPPPEEIGAAETLGMSPERYNTSIEELNLSVRAYNCLKRSGLMTVGQVLEKSDEELLALRNFGDKSFYELMDRLRELGYVADDEARGHRPETAAAAAADAGAFPAAVKEAPAEVGREEENEEISSLGSALLDALREAGQESDTLGKE